MACSMTPGHTRAPFLSMLVRRSIAPVLFSLVAACGGGEPKGSTGSSAANSTSAGMGGASGAATTTTRGMGGSGAAAGISFSRDVRPLFAERCTLCHHPNMRVLNIADPFAPEKGLVNAPNTWAVAHPEANPETQNVVPFEPENSFLMRKIGDPNIDEANSGAFMPWHIPRLTAEEIAALRQWVSDGANDDETFQTQIRPIFGDGMSLGTAGGKCGYCHYPGGMLPDLTNPFDPTNGPINTSGIGIYAGKTRIIPGDPDGSLLIQKVELTEESTEIGAPMPLYYPALTAEQVETVRQWILEGAQDN